jgi:hypothetical protein
MNLEQACEIMHIAYEKAATDAGWETQEASRVPWADVPEANKATMRAAVQALWDAMKVPGLTSHQVRYRDETLAIEATNFNVIDGGILALYNGMQPVAMFQYWDTIQRKEVR